MRFMCTSTFALIQLSFLAYLCFAFTYFPLIRCSFLTGCLPAGEPAGQEGRHAGRQWQPASETHRQAGLQASIAFVFVQPLIIKCSLPACMSRWLAGWLACLPTCLPASLNPARGRGFRIINFGFFASDQSTASTRKKFSCYLQQKTVMNTPLKLMYFLDSVVSSKVVT